jgi:hypothetical protein
MRVLRSSPSLIAFISAQTAGFLRAVSAYQTSVCESASPPSASARANSVCAAMH